MFAPGEGSLKAKIEGWWEELEVSSFKFSVSGIGIRVDQCPSVELSRRCSRADQEPSESLRQSAGEQRRRDAIFDDFSTALFGPIFLFWIRLRYEQFIRSLDEQTTTIRPEP